MQSTRYLYVTAYYSRLNCISFKDMLLNNVSSHRDFIVSSGRSETRDDEDTQRKCAKRDWLLKQNDK